MRIDLSINEATIQNLDRLQKLGLTFAAVTSPLKNKMAQVLGVLDSILAVNTLAWNGKGWDVTSTDEDGFISLLETALLQENHQIVVWGGGGVLPSIESVLPKVSYYSHRTGEPRPDSFKCSSPDVLIWCVGRKVFELQPDFPNFLKPPTKVIDLSYNLNSPAIKYAYDIGAEYISGEKMFLEQAELQQVFWTQTLSGEL